MIVVLGKAICIWYEPNKIHTTVAPPMKDKKTLGKLAKQFSTKSWIFIIDFGNFSYWLPSKDPLCIFGISSYYTQSIVQFSETKSNSNVSHTLWRWKNSILPRKSYPRVIQFHMRIKIGWFPFPPVWFECLCLRLENGLKK